MIQNDKLNIFEHSGPFGVHLDYYGSYQTKLVFLLQITLAKRHFSVFEAKNQVLSEKIKKSSYVSDLSDSQFVVQYHDISVR